MFILLTLVNERLKMKFKSERIKEEFELLKSKNVELYNLVISLDTYILDKYKKQIVLTDLFRNKAEQEKIYGLGTKRVSPHMLWHAVDLRSSIFLQKEIEEIVSYLNQKYNHKNKYKFTAMCHEVKNFGMHFHIQFVS